MQVSLRYSTYRTINTYPTYNTGYLHVCWQYNTEYSYVQKMQLQAIWATYITNNIWGSLKC